MQIMAGVLFRSLRSATLFNEEVKQNIQRNGELTVNSFESNVHYKYKEYRAMTKKFSKNINVIYSELT